MQCYRRPRSRARRRERVAAAWSGWGHRRALFAAATAALCAALLVNNLNVMDAVYEEFGAGLEASVRDADGQLLP